MKRLRTAAFVLGMGCVFGVPAAATPEGRAVEIAVTEKGFEPSPVNVKKGEPVTLVITRRTDKTCATEVLIPDHRIKKSLPLNEPVRVTFTPAKSGELKYSCGMRMLHGILQVQ